jgi:hypothetical protein
VKHIAFTRAGDDPFGDRLLRQKLTLAKKPAESRLQPGLAAPQSRPIHNRPQVTNLLHSRRHPEQTSQEIHTTTPAPENTLEILKAIRESAFARWEKRRDYEWKLSFGIWTAPAAFIAITLSRDLKVELTSMVINYAAVGAIFIFLAYAFYLTGIIEHTIVDVETQYFG